MFPVIDDQEESSPGSSRGAHSAAPAMVTASVWSSGGSKAPTAGQRFPVSVEEIKAPQCWHLYFPITFIYPSSGASPNACSFAPQRPKSCQTATRPIRDVGRCSAGT